MMRQLKSRRGVALVQVMVMSLVLLILATGVMKIVFGTHVLVARSKRSDDNKLWIESCMAQKQSLWAGNPCGGGAADLCNYAGDGGPTVNIACVAAGVNTRVTYSVSW
jgi:hypothetical protein